MARLLQREVKKLEHIVAVDLGSRTTKAVHIQRKGEGFQLNCFTVIDAPIVEKNISVDLLSEHLKSVMQALNYRGKPVILGINPNDSVVRQAEVPMMPLSDLRLMLKLNAKSYLQQDLPDHVFDAFALPTPPAPAMPGDKPKQATLQKQRVLVGGARRGLVEDLQNAAKAAGLNPHSAMPSIIAPVNAFEMAQPEIFARENVALVDIGFKSSTITILQQGEIVVSRVLTSGGDKLTQGLAESLGISYPEAESIKIRLISEVETNLEPQLSPLGRELRASIDFFEHQQDKTISQVFISGGSARAEFIVKTLQNSLYVSCQSWNPTSFLELALPPQQLGELEDMAPMLTVAVGLAASEF